MTLRAQDAVSAYARTEQGPQVARQCMRVLLLDTHPSQAPYMVLEQTLTNEPLVEQAEAWIRARLRDQFSVDELAGAISGPRVAP